MGDIGMPPDYAILLEGIIPQTGSKDYREPWETGWITFLKPKWAPRDFSKF